MSNAVTARDLLAAITTERAPEEQSLLITHVLEQNGEITLAGLDFKTMAEQFNTPTECLYSEIDQLVPLLRAIRPEYGAVGSRDIDVTAQRERIDRAISILTGRTGYTEGKQRKRYLDNIANPPGYVPLRERLMGVAKTLAEGGHRAEERTANDAIDQLDELDFASDVLDRLAKLLDGVAIALKGEPGPLEAHSWADLPELATKAVEAHAAQFLFVAMDDDRKAHLTWCADRDAVVQCVRDSMFTPDPILPEHQTMVEGVTDDLMDGGVHTFEGDAPLYLYRVASAPCDCKDGKIYSDVEPEGSECPACTTPDAAIAAGLVPELRRLCEEAETKRQAEENPNIERIWLGMRDAYDIAANIAAKRAPSEHPELHPDTAKLVRRFARSIANKLLMAQRKYGYTNNWQTNDNFDELRAELVRHVAKGDPRDVAAYCAFLWHHGQTTFVPLIPA